MRFDIITIFPKMFESPFDQGLVGQAIKEKRLELKFWDPRSVAKDAHKSVDDKPFGGGDGMVMLPEILKQTLDKILMDKNSPKKKVIYLSPQGSLLTQKKSQELAQNHDQLILICGRYGGIDERFIKKYVDEEISIGDYIVTGGELPAMVLMDSVSRFVPGTLGNEMSPLEESFKDGLLEEPLYTKPRQFEGIDVPEVLTSGHHEKINKWKKQQRLIRTFEKRPDLLAKSSTPVSKRFEKEDLSEVFKNMDLRKNVALGLVHYPVYNKGGEVVATNVTNLDIHDIARACRTFGIDNYYIITPMEEQLAFVGRVLEHWQEGPGIKYNPVRKDALSNTRAAMSVEAAIEDWGVKNTRLVATSAREVAGPKPINFTSLRELAVKEPLFILFGTGYGLENGLVRRCDYLLEPIRGRSTDNFRHLSVRSAVSIILDRLFGGCY